ncbi:MAG: DUF2750 domain-containing protein [Steroidobacteraceae bacterium]|jgi:hypothetical protein|nr:DUF2750 domain-containing protein [Steroidobacteraceae bacterium]
MPRFVNDKQYASVLALDGPKRFKHLVAQVADWGEVWGLRTAEGWMLVQDDAGNIAFPIWPHERYAVGYNDATSSGCQAVSIEVHEFVDTWLPRFADEGNQLAVFPTLADRAIFVTPDLLSIAIREELSGLE